MKRHKREKFRCSYILLLTISLLLAATGRIGGFTGLKGNSTRLSDFAIQIQGVPVFAAEGELDEEPEVQPKTVPKSAQKPEEQTKREGESEPVPGQQPKEQLTEQEAISAAVPLLYEADSSWFDDALFIGDSRTVGLHEYGDLGSAEVIADSGMSVYKIYDREFTTVSGEKKLLETVLGERSYGKIYVMLGINELGYDFEQTVRKYTELIEWIQTQQPEALIFLQANLHISETGTGNPDIYNNENIDRFNEAVKKLSDGRTRFYLDVNELFDDAQGNLSAKYTSDQVHVLGKYYGGWVEWILRHAIYVPSAKETMTY